MIITIQVSDEDGFVVVEDDLVSRTPFDDPVRSLSPAEAIVVGMVEFAVNKLGAVPR